MPLPKLPTRPAAILDLSTLERAAKAPTQQLEEIQPELDGLTSTQPLLHKIIATPTAHPSAPAFVPGATPAPSPQHACLGAAAYTPVVPHTTAAMRSYDPVGGASAVWAASAPGRLPGSFRSGSGGWALGMV